MSNKFAQILTSLKLPLAHPQLLSRIFTWITQRERAQERGDLVSQIFYVATDPYAELSRRIDRTKLQESCSVRNISRTREMAKLLISEKGELQEELLPELISKLKASLYTMGPEREFDTKRQAQILRVLQLLVANKDLVRALKKISRPLSNKLAEEVVRATLGLSPSAPVTDAHTRQAVLAAWLCFLRQNVGSCFATAPAIMVHDEQPELFLQDLTDLLATGRLKRVFGGVEYTVPISSSWGNGDLHRPIVFHLSDKGIEPAIWEAPGLMAAMEAAEVLKSEESVKVKIEQLRLAIEPILRKKWGQGPVCILSMHDILRMMLMQHVEINEEQLFDYENRPRAMIQSSLMMHVAPEKSQSKSNVSARCAAFLAQLEAAQESYKGLTDNALLKTWEFTLASFAETKFEFSSWNLYASLGMGTNEPGGIGQCIQQNIQQKLDQANQKIQEMEPEYEMVYTQVKTIESRIRHANTEKELQWLRVEYQSRINEFHFIEEQRDEARRQTQGLVDLYETLYKLYIELFKEYFQEVYDADMHEVSTGPYDDSPAGFRLLYKHGRSNTSQWTRIKTPSEFVDTLASFFSVTESQVSAALSDKKLEKELGEVVTAIITHVKTKEFLETAFYRMGKAHNQPIPKDPLRNLHKVEKKPWAYTSGGTMDTLTSCYFKIDGKPQESSKWIESEVELLVFLVDVLRQIPHQQMEPFLKGKKYSLLMQSPTHAFILKPLNHPLNKAWLSNAFTYTFVRDNFILPSQEFIKNIILDEEMIKVLLSALETVIPENYRPRFRSVFRGMKGPLNPIQFREVLMDRIERDPGLCYGRRTVLSADEVDANLFALLPLFPAQELRSRLSQLLILVPGIDSTLIETMIVTADDAPGAYETSYLSARQLLEICKTLFILCTGRTSFPIDYPLLMIQAAQQLGFAMPTPVIFADTNWVKDEFGFVVNPGTGKLELWRIDYTGSRGYPMSIWKKWVDGSQPNSKWGVYVKPPEYGQN